MNIDQPLPEQTEILYDEVVAKSHKKSDLVETSAHKHHELSECRSFEEETPELHTYEAVLSERDIENTKESSMFSHARKTDTQTNGNHHENIGYVTRPKKISDANNLSTINVESHYNALDYAVVTNPVQKGVVKAFTEESSMKDRFYKKNLTDSHSLATHQKIQLIFTKNLTTIPPQLLKPPLFKRQHSS